MLHSFLRSTKTHHSEDLMRTLLFILIATVSLASPAFAEDSEESTISQDVCEVVDSKVHLYLLAGALYESYKQHQKEQSQARAELWDGLAEFGLIHYWIKDIKPAIDTLHGKNLQRPYLLRYQLERSLQETRRKSKNRRLSVDEACREMVTVYHTYIRAVKPPDPEGYAELKDTQATIKERVRELRTHALEDSPTPTTECPKKVPRVYIVQEDDTDLHQIATKFCILVKQICNADEAPCHAIIIPPGTELRLR